MIVENQKYYHICKYPEFDLISTTDYSTEYIHRTFEKSNSDKKLLETHLEECRKQHFPENPSRHNCFYVCREDQVEIWLKKLTRGKGIWYKIYQVSVTGKIFFANENNIVIAEAYWKGCDENDKECTVEGLLIGTYRVLNDCTHKFRRP